MLSSRKKKISFHRKSFKKVCNNFQITVSLLIPNYPVEPCTTEADALQQEGEIPLSHMQKSGTLKETQCQGLLQIH